jgi:hypothetical protein
VENTNAFFKGDDLRPSIANLTCHRHPAATTTATARAARASAQHPSRIPVY